MTPNKRHKRNWEILNKYMQTQDNKPIRASLLLFGNNPRSYFSSAFLKLGRFRSPTLIVDDREAYGTLISQLDETMEAYLIQNTKKLLTCLVELQAEN